MTGPQAAMVAALTADSTLMGLLTGGILPAPLSPATAGAWATDPATGVQLLKPCAVLRWPDGVAHPSGYGTRTSIAAEWWPDLTFYAEPEDVGAIESAEDRAIDLLFTAELAGGYTVRATATRLRQMTADELPGHIQTFARRFRVTALRHHAAA